MAKFITSLPGVGGATAAILNKHGFRSIEDIATATPEAVSVVPGFRASRATKLIADAQAILAEEQGAKGPEVKKAPKAKAPVSTDSAKTEIAEPKPAKVRAPKATKPAKDEAPVAATVKVKPAKAAKTGEEAPPKVKTPKAPKAESAAEPTEDPVKEAEPVKKSKKIKSKDKKAMGDKAAGKGKKAK